MSAANGAYGWLRVRQDAEIGRDGGGNMGGIFGFGEEEDY